MIDWQRRRIPEDVPTPIAVAVADFCRRAKAPAPAALVREALALLAEEDDFRVRAITDVEPQAQPLGPFAVVDLVRGTAPAVAAQRQQTGYYEMVRTMVAERASAAGVASAAAPPAPERVVPFPAVQARRAAPAQPAEPGGAPRRGRKKAATGPTVAERIAPRRRAAGEERPAPAPAAAQLPGTAFLPRRNLPAPRGRFTRIDPSRASIHLLLRPDGREVVSALVDQVAHRVALLRSLAQGYQGRGGAELSAADVDALLDKHGLRAGLEAKEREAILGALTFERGAYGRAAQALGMRPKELEGLVKQLRLVREAQEIRDRASREIFGAGNLPLRLSLVFKTRYLEDLDIERKFRARLTDELSSLVDEARTEVSSIPALVELLARRHALDPDALRRALDALGLLDAA